VEEEYKKIMPCGSLHVGAVIRTKGAGQDFFLIVKLKKK